ncbi:2-amino-4-hydroxy-6-hydroxymethyldihydropteridine diphosphokinase [Hydrogenimonas sp.]
MKVRLREGLALVRSRRFPGRFGHARGRHRALVGVGCNLGDCAARFDKLVAYIQRGGVARVVETSPLLKNPPFGYAGQPDFLNGVMVLATDLAPHALMRWLLWVEKRFGRRRSFKNAPRTLDLDIIFYDGLRLKSHRLEVPHPRFAERESVTVPLMFLKGSAA